MNNVPAVQLPTHLAALMQDTRLSAINSAASAGISAGGWPRISIKGSRFRLQTPQGEEMVVPNLYLDVIIVDANPHGLSKTYYAGIYDPNTDEKAPDCYSDNGVGPSSRATNPQAGTCAACPHNVWGSKINPSGTQTRACADQKKIAVIIADNPEGPVFELRIPPASLKNWGSFVNSLQSRGIPASGIVTRMEFDTNADYPKLVFSATGWASELQVKTVLEIIGTEEVDVCTGKNDKPINPTKLVPSPITNSPAGTIGQFSQAAASQEKLMQSSPQTFPAQAALMPMPGLPLADNNAATNIAGEAKKTRARKTKTEEFTAASNLQPDNAPLPPLLAGMSPAAALPQRKMPPLPPMSSTPIVQPPVTNSALDEMIKKAMAV